nr:GAF domain-containing protein [Oscillochloris trichoides]
MPMPLKKMPSASSNNPSRRLREALVGCGAFFAAARRQADPLPTLRDLAADWLHAEQLEIVVPAGTGSLHTNEPGLLCGPILIGRRVIGRIEARRSLPYTEDDQALMVALGQIIGAALEHSAQQGQLDLHYHQSQAHADTLDRLLGFGRLVVSATSSPRQLALELVVQVPHMVTGERAGLLLLPVDDPDSPILALSNGTFSSTERARDVRDHGLAGLVLASREPMIIDETDTDARWLAIRDREQDAPTRCAMAVPLVWGQRLLGALTVTTTQSRLFGTPQLNLLELAACHISLAVHAANSDAYLAQATNTMRDLLHELDLAMAEVSSADPAALSRLQAIQQRLALQQRAIHEAI